MISDGRSLRATGRTAQLAVSSRRRCNSLVIWPHGMGSLWRRSLSGRLICMLVANPSYNDIPVQYRTSLCVIMLTGWHVNTLTYPSPQ